jgi:Flp pilus assembly protein TadG
MVIEAALWIPVLVLLIVGTIQFGKITFLYYTLKKTVDTAARYLAVQQSVNFCPDAADPAITAAIQFAITGTPDGSAPPQISNLTPDMIQVTTQCFDATGVLIACNTSGCGGAMGAQRPDYIVVSIPAGYPVQPRIPFITLDPIQLRPTVAVPFGGAS